MKSRRKYTIGMIVGAVLMLSLPLAYIGYRAAMKRAEAALTTHGEEDEKEIRGSISAVLSYITVGCFGTIFGLVVFTWASIRYRRAGRAAG